MASSPNRTAQVRVSTLYFKRPTFSILILFLVLTSPACYHHAPKTWEEGPQKGEHRTGPEKEWGIEILGLRPTAAGHMLDLRFRVLDPVKASALLSGDEPAFVIDQRTGKTLPVPVTKLGSLRQTTRKPRAGRVYFMLFSNVPGLVTEGSTVTVVIGDFREEDITVGAAGMPAATAEGTSYSTTPVEVHEEIKGPE